MTKPDVIVDILDVETALAFLNPNADMREIIHAMKNFRVLLMGDDRLSVWFAQLMNLTASAKLEYGKTMPDGSVRYTQNGNGGPTFVYVKDGKILRITPIDLDDKDAPSFVIRARGKTFTPDRRASINPHAQTLKSMVYSDKRILYPMKRIDFDPNGARNPQNRGKSGYVRISWDEALDMVANEIKRQRQVYGPGALAIWHGSHHQWGNVGYYLSALMRFGNLLGFTRVHHNPDSWEGWYWGATHHYGNSMRVGVSGFYGLVEDCLKEAEMIVFWSSDPESTNGYAAGYEGTKRRMWAKELGIEMVHIDPNFNPTAQLFGGRWIPIKPGTDPALSIAIMNVWMNEGLYDRDYVANRTTGFEEWRDYVLGVTDGEPKTPEWQQEETGVPAHVVRALARKWGNRKVYLSPGGPGIGFGGACRNATGTQFARNLVMMMAMQGLGKPGRQFRQPAIRHAARPDFWFPGYAEGGISGELQWTAAAPHTYCRMPHILSMNPVQQMVPRQRLPEAIIDGHAKGYPWDGFSQRSAVPAPTNIRSRAIRRSTCSTVMAPRLSARSRSRAATSTCSGTTRSTWSSTSRSGWRATPTSPTSSCRPAPRSSAGTSASWRNSGGYIHHNTHQLNHRMVMMQHKCIEPLGESKSDYDIFTGILNRTRDRRDVHRGLLRSRLGEAPVHGLGRFEADEVGRLRQEGLLRRAAGARGDPDAAQLRLVCRRATQGRARADPAALAMVG